MNDVFIEAKYPLGFREEDAKELGKHLKLRHSVELVGVKRVGISNFLRFFIYREGVVSKYINRGERHLFIPVDLNDLIEIDLFAFWILTFKRLIDIVDITELDSGARKKIGTLFLDAIQSGDAFLTIESLREAILGLVRVDIFPTIFFLHFDRLESVVNHDFFANLVGLQAASANKLAYVFTSFRTLNEISPSVFSRKLLSVFSHPIYIKHAKKSDAKIVFENFERKYSVVPSAEIEEEIIELCGGHVQYLQLSLIALNQRLKGREIKKKELKKFLIVDERIILQSEEIWESLTAAEQKILEKVYLGKKLSRQDENDAPYLWESGIVRNGRSGTSVRIFSPLFEDYLSTRSKVKSEGERVEFTKKENLFFKFLLENKDDVCEREKIIERVWPEEHKELGVSDWTVDKLVARLRVKLKKQKSKYSIVTVKTRGYKLVAER